MQINSFKLLVVVDNNFSFLTIGLFKQRCEDRFTEMMHASDRKLQLIAYVDQTWNSKFYFGIVNFNYSDSQMSSFY